ncbi:hypothetical protein ACF1B0_21305 [Streptomyces anandii]|uniref:hypothetical protein n=1 Tax=Streptomyces anandii TaxID=285454 RepID=UPI0036F823D0
MTKPPKELVLTRERGPVNVRAPPAAQIAPAPGDGARSLRLVRAANGGALGLLLPLPDQFRQPNAAILAIVAGITAASGGSTEKSAVRIPVILPVKKLCLALLTGADARLWIALSKVSPDLFTVKQSGATSCGHGHVVSHAALSDGKR